MILYVMSPLFTGPTKSEVEMSMRQSLWNTWLQGTCRDELRKLYQDGISVTSYTPGAEIFFPQESDPNALKLSFPPYLQASVPKGLVARCHLLTALSRVENSGMNRSEAVCACIDGSGAFDLDSLRLLAEPFVRDPDIDVVLGRRPPDYSGMQAGRKEIEDFEQYLLFRYRSHDTHRAFSDYDLQSELLPDGQAGCWAFRLSVASRLPLSAHAYEIEFDVLASAIEAHLKITFTEPLLMPRRARHSSVDPVPTSIKKLRFIEHKLRLTRQEILFAWRDFQAKFSAEFTSRYPSDSDDMRTQQKNLSGYAAAVVQYCGQ